MGKFCMNLIVVNKDYEKTSLRIYALVLTIAIFIKLEFIYIHSMKEYTGLSNTTINKTDT